MRFKKIVSGLLASALVVTSVFTGNVTTAKAETTALYDPVAVYDFTGETLGDGVTLVAPTASALNPYTGNAVYGTGRTNEDGDKAIKTGSYGLKLPITNLGSDYTVSMWVKPDGAIAENTNVLFVGYHAPEKWVAISGSKTSAQVCKVWNNDASASKHHQTVKEVTFPKDEWTMVTLAQSGSNLDVYFNGQLAGSGSATEAMNGADQSIWLAACYWDPSFAGYIDDVMVYNKKLTANQIYKLFDPREDEEVFAEGELKVSEQFTMLLGGDTRKVIVTLPIGLNAEKVSYSYVSSDPTVAEVDANGVITAKKVGTATITTTAKYDGNDATAKTAETAVVVKDPNVKEEGVVVDYDMSKEVGGKLIDITGNGHDAALHGSKYSFENGALKLAGSQSYVDLPQNIMDGLTNKEQFTIQVKFAKSNNANNAWLFCLGSNPQSSGTNYMFLSPNFGGATLRAGIKNSSTEKLFPTATTTEIGKSYTVNMVFDQGTIKLYWNGVKIKGTDGDELNSGFSIMDDVVTPGCKNNILGYIGKSCWSKDDYYEGVVSEFKIYDKAMTDEEVQLSDPAYQREFEANMKKALTVNQILGKNESKDMIKYNLSLPENVNEISVTWASDKPEVISDAGIIKCGAAAQNVKMTATAKSGAIEAKVAFDLTVQPLERTTLDAALNDADAALNSADFQYYSKESRDKLTKLIEQAKDAANQDDVESLTNSIKVAISKLTYAEEYKDPFAKIDESKFQDFTVGPKSSSNVLAEAIPESIKRFVTVEYTSSKPEFATVDKNTGVVTGVKLGYTMITTKVKAVSDNFEMEYQTVVKVDLDMKAITVKAATASLANGGKTQIDITYPAAVKAAGTSATYKATGAVSVNNSGQVTAKKAGTGTVIVTIKSGGKTITKKVSVNVGDITGDSKVKIKKSIILKVTGISGKVTWSLDKKGKTLATLKNGKLTAKKTGKVTVTAKVGGVTMKKTITITKK